MICSEFLRLYGSVTNLECDEVTDQVNEPLRCEHAPDQDFKFGTAHIIKTRSINRPPWCKAVQFGCQRTDTCAGAVADHEHLIYTHQLRRARLIGRELAVGFVQSC